LALFPLPIGGTGPSLESIGAKSSNQLVARFDEKAEISRINGGDDPPESDGGQTSDATRQMMPLGVGKRLQDFGLIWIGPNIVMRVMGEVDVYFPCNN
jgi:hypothetical protein